MANLVQLTHNVPICDPTTGNPTPQFMRVLQRLQIGSSFTVDSSGKIAFAALAPKTVLANLGATSAPPSAATLSQVLDLVGSAAQGDILYRNATGWVRLPGGTAGQLLQTNGPATNPTWATPSGGGGGAMALITSTKLAAAATNITFTSIPNTYKDLVITGQVRSSGAAATDPVKLQINADTAANYDYHRENSFGAASGVAAVSIEIAEVSAAGGAATVANSFNMEICNYVGTDFHKMVRCYSEVVYAAGGGNIIRTLASGRWLSTSAVTSLKVFSVANNFVIGSVISLYGRG